MTYGFTIPYINPTLFLNQSKKQSLFQFQAKHIRPLTDINLNLDYSSYLVDGSKNMVEVFWNNDGSPGSSIRPALPNLVQNGVHQFVSNFLQQQNLNIADIDGWAVHPGGAKILTSVQAGLNLNMEELSSSWNILKNYGNMSSPTVCFVLKQILKKDRKNILALAFGPGVTMEQVLMKYY